jgi:hypothetical protein
MRIFLSILLTLLFLNSCTANRTFIEKNKSDYGTIKFYIENNLENKLHPKRMVAKVNNSFYYSFYSDEIIKHTKKE